MVLIAPDETVFTGAEAVFLTLANADGHGWKLWAYRTVPAFGPVSEWIYRFVAAHRPAFSRLTHLLSGSDSAPDTWLIARWLFLRLESATSLCPGVSFPPPQAHQSHSAVRTRQTGSTTT